MREEDESNIRWGIDNYLENYIIAEQKEQYRINSFLHYWCYRGLMAAIEGDARIVADFGIDE